jgi:hypothetical protein
MSPEGGAAVAGMLKATTVIPAKAGISLHFSGHPNAKRLMGFDGAVRGTTRPIISLE